MSDNHDVLVQLAQVQGQLTAMTQLMQQNHDSTHQRINDFRHAVEGRIAGVEARVDRIEASIEKVGGNERASALKAAGSGAFSGAVMTAGIELLK